MSTIRLLGDGEVAEEVAARFDEIRKAERDRPYAPRIAAIWRCMAHWPALLESTWRKAKAVRAPGRLDALTRECVAVAVSVLNNCRY